MCGPLADPDAKQKLATAYEIVLMIRAYIGAGLSNSKVDGLVQDALEQIETVWRDLGFDDPSEHSDLRTRIISHIDPLSSHRLQHEYPRSTPTRSESANGSADA